MMKNLLSVQKQNYTKTVFDRSSVQDRVRELTSHLGTQGRHVLPREFVPQSYVLVGCVAQWLERRSLTGELSLASARSAADV